MKRSRSSLETCSWTNSTRRRCLELFIWEEPKLNPVNSCGRDRMSTRGERLIHVELLTDDARNVATLSHEANQAFSR